MAKDSIIAKPMNKVRMIERSDSGCRESASNALLMALPIANAGNMTPMAIPKMAATLDPKTIMEISDMVTPVN
jgi:hypothetical protein